jgi:hypothetical protein
MADYTKEVIRIIREHGCIFVRHGAGDHNRWYSPINKRNFTVDGSIKKRHSANETLKAAGIGKMF